MVVKHPPPNFLAPQPAANPRRILLTAELLACGRHRPVPKDASPPRSLHRHRQLAQQTIRLRTYLSGITVVGPMTVLSSNCFDLDRGDQVGRETLEVGRDLRLLR
jgi:hypothetical protein